MQIGKIIEHHVRGPGPPGQMCIPITGYFHDKTKISKENLRLDYYLLAKMLLETMHFTSPYEDQITYN